MIANPTWFNISLPRSAGKEERPNPSAGSLRNLAIPLIGGRYVFFMDADDSVDGIALVEATLHAIDRNLDVLIMPYQLVFIRCMSLVTPIVFSPFAPHVTPHSS